MNHRRKNKRTYVIAGASAAALAAGALLLPHANAGPQGPRTLSAQGATQLGRTLAAESGEQAAGWYFDSEGGRLVMNVLDEETAEQVRERGAEARVVEHSTAQLTSARDTLAGDTAVPGTAWSVDPRTNRVVVLADRTVTGTGMRQLNTAAEAMDGMVQVKRSRGEFRPFHDTGGAGDDGAVGGGGGDAGGAGGAGGAGRAGGAISGGIGGGEGANGGAGGGDGGSSASGGGSGEGGSSGNAGGNGIADGGDAIFGAGARCSLGFNVLADGAPGFLTAGHCGNESETWTSDQAGSRALGTVADSQFPETDFSLVTYDDAEAAPAASVDLRDGSTQPITEAAEAAVGMEVQRSGSTTGVSGGTVTGLDATVNYGNGDVVDGLIQTDVCAEPGDSGGALFSGEAAVGLTSGGSGDCTQGGETFFQPVTDALEATGAELAPAEGSGAAAQ